jgi:hypothetical protein
MTDSQVLDREDVRRMIDRLAPMYGRADDMPMQIVQRAAAAGDAEAKSFIETLAQSRPPPRQELFWNR